MQKSISILDFCQYLVFSKIGIEQQNKVFVDLF